MNRLAVLIVTGAALSATTTATAQGSRYEMTPGAPGAGASGNAFPTQFGGLQPVTMAAIAECQTLWQLIQE